MEATQTKSFEWVHDSILSTNDVPSFLATVDEIQRGDFKKMIPESGEELFMEDLKKEHVHWFYYESKRNLLVVKNASKAGAKPADVR